jgi:hypothetical protein
MYTNQTQRIRSMIILIVSGQCVCSVFEQPFVNPFVGTVFSAETPDAGKADTSKASFLDGI